MSLEFKVLGYFNICVSEMFKYLGFIRGKTSREKEGTDML